MAIEPDTWTCPGCGQTHSAALAALCWIDGHMCENPKMVVSGKLIFAADDPIKGDVATINPLTEKLTRQQVDEINVRLPGLISLQLRNYLKNMQKGTDE